MILGCEIDDVPPADNADSASSLISKIDKWLQQQNLALVVIDWYDKPDKRPGLPWCRIPRIECGKGPRGYRHAVVTLPTGEVLDPHPSRDGLLEVDEWNFICHRPIQD
jgi:hypothetical protein